MSGKIKIILIMLLGGVFYSAYVAAQDTPAPIGWKDFTYIHQSEAWLSSYNATGLKHLPVNSISMAEAYADKKDGKFINYYQSDNSYDLGAKVESFYRLNPKIVFYGKISYGYFKGKNMGGSAFINPYDNSFDIIEHADSTRGNKNLETYNLIGAISADLYKGLVIGAKIDYKAANYAKTKDLRHANKLLDMSVTAGVSYELNPKFEIGLNYYYRRNVEDIQFSIEGTDDKVYESLISFGSFYGKSIRFDNSDYMKEGDTKKPVFNQFHGLSLQLDFHLDPAIHLFNEFTYKSRNGYYGEKNRSTTSLQLTKHNSDIFEYKGIFSFSKNSNHHSLRIDIDNEKLVNYENVYQPDNQGGGTTIYIYYDPLKVADKNILNAKIEYTGNLGITDFNPTWVLKAGIENNRIKQTTSIYPYYRKQTIRRTTANLSAKRNIIKGINMYSFMLGATYSTGGGTPKDDRLYAPPSEGRDMPANIDRYLYREYEYLTNDQWKGNIGFQYSRLFDKIGIKGYTSLNYSYTKASKVEYLQGSSFNEINLTIGCTF